MGVHGYFSRGEKIEVLLEFLHNKSLKKALKSSQSLLKTPKPQILKEDDKNTKTNMSSVSLDD